LNRPARADAGRASFRTFSVRGILGAQRGATMSTATSQRDERIDLRVSADLKSLLSRAASYSGMSLSSFLVSIAADRAKAVVAEHEALTLSPRDWEAFLAALDDVDRPRPRLAAAVRRYQSRRGRDDT
jgi:uncharacterized protein (DUF1778 family)